MSINRKSIVVLGITLVVGVTVVLWLVSLIFTFRLNQRQILFEFGQMSAWTARTAGFFIDSEGNVLTFDNDLHQNAFKRFIRGTEEKESAYTTSELFQYYGNSSQLVGKIDTNILNEMISLIQPSSTGVLSGNDPLTPVECASHDAGIYTYRAYLYDNDLKTHTPVYLYTMGDIKELNLSQEGKTLYKWLETTCIENGYSASCKPNPHICRP